MGTSFSDEGQTNESLNQNNPNDGSIRDDRHDSKSGTDDEDTKRYPTDEGLF